MTDKDLKYIPQTYEQFVLEETNLNQQDLYPDLVYEDVSEQKGYGPCFKSFYNECNCGFRITAVLVDVHGNSRSETIYPTSEQQVKDLELRIIGGLGEWAYSSGFRNEFDPHQESRTNLSLKINLALAHCGPQTVTVVEKTKLQRFLEK